MTLPPTLTDPGLAAIPGLVHGFTTRAHGSAELGRADDALGALGMGPASNWTRREARQVHGCAVWQPGDVPGSGEATEADAFVTDRARDLLVVRVADCLPALLAAVDARGRPVAVAAAHAGWRGLVAGVLAATVRALAPLGPGARLVGAIGPCIGPCCFEVGPEVALRFRSGFGEEVVRDGLDDRSFVDLPGAARRQLAALGVHLADGVSTPCTRCEPGVYHSHRAAGPAAGRNAAYIGLTG